MTLTHIVQPADPLAEARSGNSTWPFVTVIIPCRNEASFVKACLDSVLANDYPADRLEILLIDGRSEDGTREILAEYTRRYPGVQVLDNPKRITPAALNVGIAAAHGDVIVRMDAHARLDSRYVSRSIRALESSGADNVGGVMHTRPQRDTLVGRAIVRSLSHPFGVGNSYFRVHTSAPRWVDTVFGGCYRREVFSRIGMFNERLARGQDMEFNLRLKKCGGRTLLVPDIESDYYARSDLRSFLKHNWGNGLWAILPFYYSEIMPVTWRHLVPLAFVVAMISALTLAAASVVGRVILSLVLGAYLTLNLFASAHVGWRQRDVRVGLLMPLVFAGLHVSYGLGSFWGVLVLLGRRLRYGAMGAGHVDAPASEA